MSNVILQPSSNKDAREHYVDTIANPVSLERIRSYINADEKSNRVINGFDLESDIFSEEIEKAIAYRDWANKANKKIEAGGYAKGGTTDKWNEGEVKDKG